MKTISKKLLFLLLLLPLSVLAQSTVSGVVSDKSSGQPLPGVNVIIKGTSKGTTTDFDGKYVLSNVTSGEVIEFSYVGFTTQDVPYASQKTINVSLEEETAKLDEVVLVGYGAVKKKDATGSVTQVTTKDFNKGANVTAESLLNGRVAGVTINQSGAPGSGSEIRIRGGSSLLASNDPLIVIDGLPVSNSTGEGATSILSSINPNDIESFTVLKDASATAIYGSRASNGVIIITTKRAGKNLQVDYNFQYGSGKKFNQVDVYNADQFRTIINTEFEGNAAVIGKLGSANTDWQDELIGGTSYTNSIQTTVSGGSESTRFLLSGTHYKETTVFPGDFAYKKASVNFNVNHTSTDKKFEITLSGNYTVDKNNLLGTDLTREAYSLAPNAPEVYNSEGELNWENSTWNNPLRLLEEKYLTRTNNLIANGMLIYRPFKGWELKAGLGFTDSSLKESKTSPHTIYDPAYGFGSEISSLLLNDAKVQSWNFEPQLSFNQEVLGGNVNALVGATFQSRNREQSGLYAWGFSNNNLINNIAAASNIIALGTDNSQYRYSALFGRVNYSYRDRYFINLTGRRDGSSRFVTGEKFANFGAVGAAWLFSREKFFVEKTQWLSFGKLRGSYGITGSDQIGDYQFLNTYNLSGISYGGIIGLEPTRLFNPDFSWETNKKIEAALELGFLRDKLYLTVAHYRNRSSNQLVGIPLPGTTGFPSITANLNATVQNTGWEFELQGRAINNDNFKWTTSLNLTVPRNKLVSFPNLDGSTYANIYVLGQPLDIQKVYHYTGMNPATGIYEFEDYDGDGQITAGNDREKVVRTSPEYFGGLQNSISYKKWNLDFLFQFVKQLGSNYNYLGVLPGIANNLPADFTNAWQQPGDNSTIQPYTTGLNSDVTNAYYRFLSSDAAFSDASFIRLKNLSLSYTLPMMWSESTSCRVYFQGQNLLTITRFKGPDPESQSTGRLPPLRVFSVGVELNF